MSHLLIVIVMVRAKQLMNDYYFMSFHILELTMIQKVNELPRSLVHHKILIGTIKHD